jgi:hypothetical protein
MKAILEFDLPSEREEYEDATDGWKYSIVLWEMDQWLRSKIKYDDTLTDEQYDIYEGVRKRLWEIAEENEVTL